MSLFRISKFSRVSMGLIILHDGKGKEVALPDKQRDFKLKETQDFQGQRLIKHQTVNSRAKTRQQLQTSIKKQNLTLQRLEEWGVGARKSPNNNFGHLVSGPYIVGLNTGKGAGEAESRSRSIETNCIYQPYNMVPQHPTHRCVLFWFFTGRVQKDRVTH